ncbi:Uncharacterised protein [Candidatus Gugararchaeum adminiculabundum]|nr:Uncharacterised protein [Candidatus Gugararchaeum adminiculabundum]
MKKISLFIALFAVAAMLALGPLVSAAFTEHKRVVVEGLDGSRVINATVVYKFQTNDWYSYDGKGETVTGKDGTVNVTLYNIVPKDQQKNEAWFQATYGKVSSGWVSCNYDLDPDYDDCVLYLPVYELRVYVRDHNERPLEGMPVSVDNGLAYTDSGGQVKVFATKGVHDVKVQFGEIVEQQTVDLQKSETLAMEIKLNDLVVNVKDDKGLPLRDAIVIVRDMEFTPDINGVVKIGKFDAYTTEVRVRYQGEEKSAIVDVASEPNYSFLFDVNPPLISNVQVSEDKTILVGANVQDQNEFGSGMGVGARVELTYAIDGAWRTQEMFRSGLTGYQATIPLQPAGTQIQYKVRAKDLDGNWAETQIYTYTASKGGVAPKPPNGQNGTNNNGNNGGNGNGGGFKLELPSIGLNVDTNNPVCLGGLGLVLVIVVLVFLKRRKEDAEDDILTPMPETPKPEEKK